MQLIKRRIEGLTAVKTAVLSIADELKPALLYHAAGSTVFERVTGTEIVHAQRAVRPVQHGLCSLRRVTLAPGGTSEIIAQFVDSVCVLSDASRADQYAGILSEKAE